MYVEQTRIHGSLCPLREVCKGASLGLSFLMWITGKKNHTQKITCTVLQRLEVWVGWAMAPLSSLQPTSFTASHFIYCNLTFISKRVLLQKNKWWENRDPHLPMHTASWGEFCLSASIGNSSGVPSLCTERTGCTNPCQFLSKYL